MRSSPGKYKSSLFRGDVHSAQAALWPGAKLSSLMQTRLKRPRSRRNWWRGAVLILALWPFVAWAAARFLIVATPVASADAIVVLSGSAAYLERTQKAAELYQENYAPLVILTNDNQQGGWSTSEQRNPFFVERARHELKRAGVPSEKIQTLPQTVSSTHDESVRLRDYAEAHQLNSFLVVTSAYHSRRALWTLRRVFDESGVEISLIPASAGDEQTFAPATWWLHQEGWAAVAGEYLKIIYYQFKYS